MSATGIDAAKSASFFQSRSWVRCAKTAVISVMAMSELMPLQSPMTWNWKLSSTACREVPTACIFSPMALQIRQGGLGGKHLQLDRALVDPRHRNHEKHAQNREQHHPRRASARRVQHRAEEHERQPGPGEARLQRRARSGGRAARRTSSGTSPQADGMGRTPRSRGSACQTRNSDDQRHERAVFVVGLGVPGGADPIQRGEAAGLFRREKHRHADIEKRDRPPPAARRARRGGDWRGSTRGRVRARRAARARRGGTAWGRARACARGERGKKTPTTYGEKEGIARRFLVDRDLRARWQHSQRRNAAPMSEPRKAAGPFAIATGEVAIHQSDIKTISVLGWAHHGFARPRFDAHRGGGWGWCSSADSSGAACCRFSGGCRANSATRGEHDPGLRAPSHPCWWCRSR